MSDAAGDGDGPTGKGPGPVEVVGGDQDGGSTGDRFGHDRVHQVPTPGVEAGVGFVEQPELGTAGAQDGEGGAAALTGGQAGRGHVPEPASQAQPVERGLNGGRVGPGGPDGEAHVVEHREVVVEPGGVPEQADAAAHRPPVDAQVLAQDDGGTAGEGHEAGTGAQDRGLAGAVRPGQQDHLPGRGVEVDTSEGGKASEQADGVAEVDGEAHASGARLPGDTPGSPKGAGEPGGGGGAGCGTGAGTRAAGETGAGAGRRGGGKRPRGGGRRRRGRDDRLTTFLMGTGKTFIALGLLCLGFVAYELLGTNLAESRHQHDLRAQLRSVLPGVDQAPGGPPTPAPAPTPTGKAVAIIEIPSIGVNKAVVEGVELTDLKLGPGHYPGTPLPGQPGNAAIAGHRTTYGAPFFNIDQVKPGDEVFVTTKQGRFEYKAVETRIVKPSEVTVVAPTKDNRLTLTSCNPRFSAAQRIVLVSQLIGPAAPAPPPTANPQPRVTEVIGATSDPRGRTPTIVWGLATLVLGAAIWALGRRWRRWAAYLLGAAPFVVVLFVFYENLARVIPS